MALHRVLVPNMVDRLDNQDAADNVSTVSSDAKPIFAIFEGGGAKGIAHVGAYAAADEMKLEFVGVAGASAGAIVAALIAVGFKPAEIFNPEKQAENIFSAHDLTATQALGQADWLRFQRLRRYWFKMWIPALFLFVGASGCRLLGWTLSARRFGELLLLTIVASAARAWILWTKRGIFDPRHFGDKFNEVLRDRVLAVYAEDGKATDRIPDKIRFRDIDPRVVSRFCRLKIVATDISGQQLRLFDHRTADVVVAEAVAASIAIPGLFKPAAIPSFATDTPGAFARYYADGGLVSNLPVWCFSEEKAAAERRRLNSVAIPIVAFTLSDSTAADPGAALSPLRYFVQVIQSAIFGGQTVVQEFVPDLYPVQLPSHLSVLAFDATWEQARSAHEEARQRAAVHLRQKLMLEPQEWARVLSNACHEIQKIIVSYNLVSIPDRVRLRAAVFEPNPPSKRHLADTFVTAYKVTRSYNMERDTDDRLTLDAECPGVPEAFEQCRAVLWSPAGITSRATVMTKYERALVRRGVNCAMCVPIFSSPEQWNLASTSRNQPLAVVAFDTDEDILVSLQGQPAVLNAIIEATFGISAVWTELRRKDP